MAYKERAATVLPTPRGPNHNERKVFGMASKVYNRKGVARKHGHASTGNITREYSIWMGMRQRCNNPKATHYSRYGARGISVCSQWDDFRQFLEDMGDCPSPGHSIDRIDPDGNYTPDNCRWATHKEQMVNTTRNRWIEWHGERLPISHAIKRSGVSPQTVYRRLAQGWAIEQALDRPAHYSRRHRTT